MNNPGRIPDFEPLLMSLISSEGESDSLMNVAELNEFNEILIGKSLLPSDLFSFGSSKDQDVALKVK
jgi:hypothetical protein